MKDKMKVWECRECNPYVSCLCSDGIGNRPPTKCIHHLSEAIKSAWTETTAFEITERKPDYAGMAEKDQFGTNGNGAYGYLADYWPNSIPHFSVKNSLDDRLCYGWHFFTPCAEPVELDPITLEPKK